MFYKRQLAGKIVCGTAGYACTTVYTITVCICSVASDVSYAVMLLWLLLLAELQPSCWEDGWVYAEVICYTAKMLVMTGLTSDNRVWNGLTKPDVTCSSLLQTDYNCVTMWSLSFGTSWAEGAHSTSAYPRKLMWQFSTNTACIQCLRLG